MTAGMAPAAMPAGACEVLPSGPVQAALRAPSSKSLTNRVLVVAALADGDSVMRDGLVSDDSRAMLDAVAALGAEVSQERDTWRIRGTGGRLRVPPGVLDARLSGTTMRFLAAVAVLAPGPVEVSGLPPLLRRPVGPLVDGLRALGASVRCADGFPPVVASGGGMRGGWVRVDVSGSSQFASGILLVAPYADTDVTLQAVGSGSRDYVEITAAVMRAWGADVDRRATDTWSVRGAQRYAARDVAVEYDASAAAHLFALAMATGGAVTVTNTAPATLQPDATLPALFARMGATVERDGTAVTVRGPERMAPLDADLSRVPDQVTTLGALAALADGVSDLRNVAVARTHETDRLTALATELGKLGVRVDQRTDGLRVHGGAPRGPARLATYDDHRLAMAFAALAARVPGVTVDEPWCVSKTYPAFWSDLAAAGVEWREVPA